jgi:heat shock protein HtpX
MNLIEQQASNRRRTWVVMGVFVLFFVLVGAGFDVFILGGGQSYAPVATIGAALFASGSAWLTLRSGDRAVLASAAAEPVESRIAAATTDDERLRLRQFDNIVAEMAIAAGLPKPKAYVIPDDDPNAFATGRDPEHASIAVTEGLLHALNREELQGVVAHEMSHVRNLDTRLMMIIAALVGGVVLLADWSARAMWFGGGRGRRGRDSGGAAGAIGLVVWLIAIVIAPILAQLLAMAVSRTREYLADASGAELTRNPLGLASALKKIDGAVAPTTSIKRGSAHLCIADPLGRVVGTRESRWSNLWATHPPMDRRIAALDAMAYHSSAPAPAPARS